MKTISILTGATALLITVIITLFFLNALSLLMLYIVKRNPKPEAEYLSNYYCCLAYGMYLPAEVSHSSSSKK